MLDSVRSAIDYLSPQGRAGPPQTASDHPFGDFEGYRLPMT
jgi:hypothetical protein